MTPRSMAIAWLIHHDCTVHGWDRTAAQVAEDLAERYPAARHWQPSGQLVARIARAKGWTAYLRGSGTPPNEGVPATLRMDAELEAMDGGRVGMIEGFAA